MLLLGIETSCDETAAALVDDRRGVVSEVVFSQVDLHRAFGGIVPEIASRAHIEKIAPVVADAFARAGAVPADLDAVAATSRPGLVGSLLVGLNFAKGMALALNLPFVGVSHLEAHLFSPFVGTEPPYPFVGLIVSGGHTRLYLAAGPERLELLGNTLDDAAGEAYDKVAKLLGMGYPGGVAIDRLAAAGDARAFPFPRPMLGSGTLDFSFSGLKTAVKTQVERNPPAEGDLPDLCASFQAAATEVLAAKARAAVRQTGARTLAVSGGVAANAGLRSRLGEVARSEGIELAIPPPGRCTDNAAMVGWRGLMLLAAGRCSPLDINAEPGEE